ncbi:MAG TPA: hypothetical protein PK961_17660 [bacterium]|nr:hypothetical protein [bacterium]
METMKKSFLPALSLCLLAVLVFAAPSRDDVNKRLRERLAEIDGFDATYEAVSASERKIVIRVRYRRPDKMRMDLDPLGAVMLFDGDRYLYYDAQRAQAIALDGREALRGLREVHRSLSAITWAELADFGDGAEGALYPSLNMELDFERLDISITMATRAHQHSWVNAVKEAERISDSGTKVILQNGENERDVRTTIDLETGLLDKIELKSAAEPKGALKLAKVEFRAVPEDEFAFTIPPAVQVRNQKDDPSLLQQLLISGFRGNFDRILWTARDKWSGLSDDDKAKLDRAMHQVFTQVFTLALDDTRRNIAAGLHGPRVVERVRGAYNDQEGKRRFAADQGELPADELDRRWRNQVVEETMRLLLVEIIKTVDQEVVEALRQQALERTAGMDDAARKDLVRAVTEPVHRAFIDLIVPTIRTELAKNLE